MKSLIVLKILCQLSFYFAVASFIVGIFSGGNLVLVFPLVVTIVLLTVWLKPRGAFRYAPLLLFGLCFFIVSFDLLHIIALLPAFIYAVFAADYINEKNSKQDYQSNFKRALMTFLSLFVFAIFYTATPLGEFIRAILVGNYIHGHHRHPDTPLGFYLANVLHYDALLIFFLTVLPIGIFYLWSALMFLRTQEYEVETRSPFQFKLVNAVSITKVITGILVFGLITTFLISLIRLPEINWASARESCPLIFLNDDYYIRWCVNRGDGDIDEEIFDGHRNRPVECWCPNDNRLDPDSPRFIGEWLIPEQRFEVSQCGWHFTYAVSSYLYLVVESETGSLGRERYITESGHYVDVNALDESCLVEEDDGEFIAGRNPTRDIIILVTATLTVLVVVIVLLVRKRPRFNKANDNTDDDVEEIRTTISEPKSMKKRTRRWNENQVRAVYQKFLNELTKNGIKVTIDMTTLDVESLAKADRKMRSIYTKVRYAESEYSKEDVKLIKQIYREVRAELKRKE